jgi:hypothetical protein
MYPDREDLDDEILDMQTVSISHKFFITFLGFKTFTK